jgi:predicted transcriptional regulator
MDEQYLNAYAYLNMQKALLANLLADYVSKANKPDDKLQALLNETKIDLEDFVFPANAPETEIIRKKAIALAQTFFQDTEGALLKSGIELPHPLVL